MTPHDLSRIDAADLADQAERLVQRLMRRYSTDTRDPAPASSQDPAFRHWLARASGLLPAAMERADPAQADLPLIPADLARQRLCVALRLPDQATALVLADPFDRGVRLWLESRLRQAGRLRTRWYVAPAPALLSFVARAEQAQQARQDHQFGVCETPPDGHVRPATALEPLNRLLRLAIDLGASHLHLGPASPQSPAVGVRLRIDGRLQALAQADELPAALLDTLRRHLREDGQLALIQGTRALTLPVALHADHAVLQLPPATDRSVPSLAGLDLTADSVHALRQALQQPHGLTLVVTPARQGRSRLLEALEGECRQTGLLALRLGTPSAAEIDLALARDPDRLLIDDAIDASAEAPVGPRLAALALEGQALVLSVRAASPWAALERLQRAGLPREVLARTLQGLLVQRLLPRLCPHCDGLGCADCHDSGRLGRCAVETWIALEPTLAEAIERGAPAARLARLARRDGTDRFARRLAERVRAGEISAEDAERAAALAS